MLDVARALKERKAARIYAFSTFGLFTNGLERFDECYKDGTISKIITTNVTYQTPELLGREWYESADLSKYIALLIDNLNHDVSISSILDPTDRIQSRIEEYKLKHTIDER